MNFDLQVCLVQDLLLDQDLKALVADRILDNVPDKTLYPLVQIGDISFSDSGDKSFPGNECVVPIHVWTQNRGKREAEQIMKIIYKRWHERENLVASGFQITLIRHTYSQITTERDNLTRHGVANYRVLTYGA